MTSIQKYIKSLQKFDFSQVTEHSLRFELNTLLNEISCRKVDVLHEGKREGKFGSPVFKVLDIKGIIGYVETKKIEDNLDYVIKSEQIKKYIQLSDNILLTNYLEFVWIRKGKIVMRETLCYLNELSNNKYQISKEKGQHIEDLIKQFLEQTPKGINNSKELAHSLAARTKILKEFLRDTIQNQISDEIQSSLTGLYHTFRTSISSDLTVSEFSDAFAQMLSYGIFLAKLNAETKYINLFTAKQFVPKSFELIYELIGFIDKLENDEYANTRWIVEEIITLLNNIDVPAIQANLSFNKNKNPNQLVVADPYLYFYEEFLSVYDFKLRKAKGVYYTPPEIVSFIIRSAGHLLETEFGIKQQFADSKKITVLDFATGTGTFILEILKQILNSAPPNSTKRQILIQEHILKNIYGFEYLIAPYTIAHLKLSQFLKDNNYELQPKERLQVYLTNTIEPLKTQYNVFVQALSDEGLTAQKIKEKPILVITGNPPYSNSSTNRSPFIINLLNDYKSGLNEKRINLDDDYIKFIRFAHNKIDKVGKGIVAIITNNSFLEGVTHRKMRQKLYEDFDKIYILNLHGNAIRKDGDDNIFDIRVGVSVLILVRLEKRLKNKEVFYFSTKEIGLIKRQQKLNYFENVNFEKVPFDKLTLSEPYFWFINKDLSLQKSYDKFIGISEIFKIFGSGVSTLRDKVCIQFTKKELNSVIADFNKLSIEQLRDKYELSNSRDWTIARAKKDIEKNINNGQIVEIHYRPFDKRYTFYTGTSRGFIGMPQKKVAFNLLEKINFGLVFPRYVISEFMHCFVSNTICEYSLGGIHTASETNIAPLYFYFEQNGSTNGNGLLFDNTEGRKLNFTDKFKGFINETYQNIFTAEEIFYYIYAVLYSTTYREKYLEFLKIDFPKIPFTNDFEIFKTLSTFGKQLVNAHTFNGIPNHSVGLPMGLGNTFVTNINYKDNRLFYNDTNYFENVSEDVFNFKIGGYQIVEKYLKERKNRKLENNEITRVEEIINIIDFTIKQMKEIDTLTQNWI